MSHPKNNMVYLKKETPNKGEFLVGIGLQSSNLPEKSKGNNLKT